MVTRTRYQQQYAKGAQMPHDGGLASGVQALQSVALDMRRKEKKKADQAKRELKQKRMRQSANAVQEYQNLVNATDVQGFESPEALKGYLSQEQGRLMSKIPVTNPEQRQAYALQMDGMAGQKQRNFDTWQTKKSREAQSQQRENALLDYGNQIQALDFNDFAGQDSLNASLTERENATLERLNLTDASEREEMRLRLQRQSIGVQNRYRVARQKIDDAGILQGVSAKIDDFDFTIQDVNGEPIYDPLSPQAAEDLRRDLMGEASSDTASVGGMRGEALRLDIERKVNQAVERFNTYAARAQKDHRGALAERNTMAVEQKFTDGDMTLEQAQDEIRQIAVIASDGLASDEEIELAVAEQTNALMGLRIDRMVAEGKFAEVRSLLHDPDVVGGLTPQAHSQIIKQLNRAGVESANEYVSNQQALVVNGRGADDADTVAAEVLEMTGSPEMAQEAVQQVEIAQVMADNMLLPLADVAQQIQAERAAITDDDPDAADKFQRLDAVLEYRQKAEKALQKDPVAYLAQEYQDQEIDTVAEQMRLGVKEPRILSNQAAAELISVMQDTEVAPAEKAAVLAQGLMQNPEIFTRDAIRAGLSAHSEPILFAMSQGSVDEFLAPKLVGAMVAPEIKLDADTKTALKADVADALEGYTEYANELSVLSGDYGYQEDALYPVRDAMRHILAVTPEDAGLKPEQLAKALMGGKIPQVTDDVVALVPEGDALHHGELLALREIRTENTAAWIDQRKGEYTDIAALQIIADEGVWHSKDGETFTLIEPAMGTVIATTTRAEIAARAQMSVDSQIQKPGQIR